MYELFCDSNCELWYTTIAELRLKVIKMPYVVDDAEYFYDMGEEMDFKAFFEKMRQGATPKTAALNEYAYIEYFEPVLKEGKDIYYVTFSHQMSATFASMKTAIEKLKEKYPDRQIRYKDSKLISMGSGFVTYYAALEYQNGATMDELDAYLDGLIPNVATYFVVDNLTYLYRGGRVSGASRLFGNLLGIKPILHIDENGKIVNVAKAKGMKKALTTLSDYLKEKGSELDKYKIFIVHADCLSQAEAFAVQLKERFGKLDITIQDVGPVIGAHCGPGTIGLIFHAKER